MDKSNLVAFLLLILSLILSGCGSQQTSSTGSPSKEISSLTTDIKTKILSTIESAPSDSYISGELIVKFKSDIKSSRVSQIHKAHGATVIKSLGIIGKGSAELIKIPDGTDIKGVMASYMSDPAVEYAEPNYKRFIRMTMPNDTYFTQQWALYNTGSFANGFAGADIKAPIAWDFSRGSNNLIVAVIDTGVDYNHEDLFGKIWINTQEICTDGIDNDDNGFVDDCYGWNFFNSNNNPIDLPAAGHGTHVAGVIGATTNNGFGISGILWHVKIMPLKFIGPNGGSIANAVAALNYAVRMGAKIVNASYGSSTYSQLEYDSIAAANERGVLFIAAAGNDAENNDFSPSYPCSYGLPNIISVAASDQRDNIASFSNFGPTKVDVAAPGTYILSLIPNNGFQNKDFWPGTSMATPHVVGAAGLVLTAPEYINLGFSIYQTRAFLEEYVDKLPAFAGKIKSGGRINAYRSVTAMLKPENLTVSTTGPTSVEPLRVHLSWQNRATGAENIRIERLQEGVDSQFVEIAQISPNTNSFTDTAVSGERTYRYRVRAFKSLSQSYVPIAERLIYTPYTNVATATTPIVPLSFGGGSGCSVSASPARDYKYGLDAILILAPLLLLMVLRRKGKN